MDDTLADLLKERYGWKSEEKNFSFLPLIPTFYIIRFLMMDSAVEDLSDYKSSKAYIYFRRGWLGNIYLI